MRSICRATRGLPRYQTIQNEYNLYTRGAFEGPVQDIVLREGLGAITYYGLASGFLTGKYRSTADLSQSQRGEDIAQVSRCAWAADSGGTRCGLGPHRRVTGRNCPRLDHRPARHHRAHRLRDLGAPA